MGNTEIAYLKNQITLLREEMKNLLIALLESGLIEITEEDGKKVYKINKVKQWLILTVEKEVSLKLT